MMRNDYGATAKDQSNQERYIYNVLDLTAMFIGL